MAAVEGVGGYFESSEYEYDECRNGKWKGGVGQFFEGREILGGGGKEIRR